VAVVFTPETHEGEWWLPEHPERRLRGTLSLTERGLHLALNGQLFPPVIRPGESHSIGSWRHLSCLYGVVDTTEEITLVDVKGFSWELQGGNVSEQWTVGFALFGAFVEPNSTYDRIILTTEHLDVFARVPWIEAAMFNDSDGNPETVRVEVTRSVVITGAVEDVGQVSVRFEPEFHSADYRSEVGLRGEVVVAMAAPIEHQVALTTAGVFRDLVRLATCCECALTSLTLNRPSDGARLRVVCHLAAVGREPCERDVFGHLLFDARTLPAGASAFQIWWRLRHRQAAAWNLLTMFDDDRILHLGERFSTYARSVEAIHQADFGFPQLAADERDERIIRALDILPEYLRGWAQPLLEGSTPPVFRHRIMEVVRDLEEVGEILAGGDVEAFALAVSATRNAIIHPEHRPSAHALDVDGRFWVGSALYWIGHAYLAHKLGMTLKSLASRLHSVSESSEVIRRMGERFGPPDVDLDDPSV
jgi:ApeA N-terminal domain 1